MGKTVKDRYAARTEKLTDARTVMVMLLRYLLAIPAIKTKFRTLLPVSKTHNRNLENADMHESPTQSRNSLGKTPANIHNSLKPFIGIRKSAQKSHFLPILVFLLLVLWQFDGYFPSNLQQTRYKQPSQQQHITTNSSAYLHSNSKDPPPIKMSDLKPDMDSDAEQYSINSNTTDPKNMQELTLYVSIIDKTIE